MWISRISFIGRIVFKLALVLHIFNPFAFSQSYRINRLTTADGLSHNEVRGIWQDHQGFMWFVTLDGINRYDGHSFKVYKPAPGRDFSSNWVSNIGEDSEGNLWMEYGGLQKYDRKLDRFVHYPQDSLGLTGPKGHIDALAVDLQNNVWLGTTRGIEKYDYQKRSFELIDSTIRKLPWTMLMVNDDLWLVHYSTGQLLRFNTRSHERKAIDFSRKDRFEIARRQKFAVAEADSGRLWVLCARGVIRFDPETEEQLEIIEHPSGQPMGVGCLVNDQSNFLWIGSQRNDIIHFDPKTRQLSDFTSGNNNQQSPFASTYTNAYCSRDGALWFGSFKGIVIIRKDKNPFQHVEPQADSNKALPYGDIKGIVEDARGNLWFALFGKGLAKLDRTLNAWYYYRAPVIDAWVGMLHETRHGTILVGGNGLFEFEISGNSKPKKHSLPLPRLEQFVLSLAETDSSTTWISTFPHGIFRMSLTEPWRNYRSDSLNELQENRTPLLYYDSFGDLWAASYGMIYRYDALKDRFLRKKEIRGLPYVMHRKSRQHLWIGSMEGLILFDLDQDSLTYFTDSNGIEGRQIFGFLEDDHDNLWLSTDMGITKFNMKTKKTRNFGSAGEFPRPSIKDNNMDYHAFTKLHNGRLMFGFGTSGYVSFHPDSVREDSSQFDTFITGFTVFGEPIIPGPDNPLKTNVTTASEIHLKHDQNSFTLEFATLDYSSPLKTSYSYILEGFQDNWVSSGHGASAIFTNIPPGEYVFRAMSSNMGGIRNKEASIMIIITPPWWKTWWAYSIYGFLFLGLLYGARNYELNRQKLKHDAELEHIEAEKLREMDQMKSRFFANISHEFRTPLTLIEGPARRILGEEGSPKENAHLIVRNSSRLLQLVNQLLDLSKIEAGQIKLKVEHTNLCDLVKGIGAAFETMAKKKDIRYKVEVPEREEYGWVDGDAVEKCITNLISNAMKFTPEGGSVTLAMESDGLRMAIRVSDSGIGLDESNMQRVFDRFYQVDTKGTHEYEGTGIGLALTKELVELHHGAIGIESTPGVGSTFTISIPVNKESYTPDQLSESVLDKKVEIKVKPQEEMKVHEEEDVKNGQELPLILVIEDNEDMRKYIRMHLNGFYKVAEASDGVEGLEKAIETVPDLIISDQMMPKMEGSMLVQKVKSDPRISHIPVILLTAKAEQRDKLEGLGAGADDYLVKPFDAQELKTRMDNLILQRRKLWDKFRADWMTKPREVHAISSDEKFLAQVMDIIEKNMSDPDFDLNCLAEKTAMSRVQLHRKLKALTGLAPGEFIRNYRLDRAAQLLKKKAGNVSEIAFDVGFNNLSYFAKAFREKFGVNPSDF